MSLPSVFLLFVALTSSVGTGDSATFAGAPDTSPYRLHIQEQEGFPLLIEATLLDESGQERRNHRYFIGANDHYTFQFEERFAEVRLTGVNGSGEVTATAVSEHEDGRPVPRPVMRASRRSLFPISEIIAWAAATVGLLGAAVWQRR